MLVATNTLFIFISTLGSPTARKRMLVILLSLTVGTRTRQPQKFSHRPRTVSLNGVLVIHLTAFLQSYAY